MQRNVLAYFISFHTYGSWMHGSASGSVDPLHNAPGSPFIEPNLARLRFERSRQAYEAIQLDAKRRESVQNTIMEVCIHRGWRLIAVHVRTTHVHVVMSAPNHTPERVLNDLKSWCTRRMVEAGVLSSKTKAWSRHGSTRYLWTNEDVVACVEYVINQQGVSLEGGPEPHLSRQIMAS